MYSKLIPIILLTLWLGISSCNNKNSPVNNPHPISLSWCNQPLREQFNSLKKVKVKSSWFKVFEVGHGVYAIAEPSNFQEVISYLILGEEKALLFDSGMGLSSIKKVVKQLTNLPLTVINSHTHYDHIGGNHEFDNILAIDLPYTIGRAKNGMSHDFVKHEVTKEAICLEKSPNKDTANYHIKPFKIKGFIKEGYIFQLGNRTLEIISVPGHTPDAIALYDKASGYLWTGDTFYEGPIWLFDPETNLFDYQQSIQKIANISGQLSKVFPAHNTPIADPKRLKDLNQAFHQIMIGEKKAENSTESKHVIDAALLFKFEGFSFYIRKNLLTDFVATNRS